MTLKELLLENLEREIVLFDKNDCVIANGRAGNLFNTLGYYFLDLKVIYNGKIWVNVDVKLGGDE